ncbi:MAG: FtsX-like permease family protein, partial [Planctomycetaceae bacterium]
LSEGGFAVMSETGRITEIHRQDHSLQLLVVVVGAGVFLFGIVTVISVLIDSTDRKRGTIGVLRVMGMSRLGIFVSILARATAIGAIAAALSLLLGLGLSAFLGWNPPGDVAWLRWKPVVYVSLDKADLFLVASGAMLCCACGAVPPAWKASRIDPFEAIVEGRFR